MGWMRIAGFVIVLGLLAACDLDAKTPNQCQTDDQCREGAYCDVGRALCVTACEKVGCLEGHFCDPSAHTCGTECSFGCTAPENATAICRAECGYTCNPGSHLCGEQCPLNTDATACGTSCKVCPAENGTAVCNDGECGRNCSGGFYDTGATCKPCNEDDHCGPSCTLCAVGEFCNGTTCASGSRFYRYTVPDKKDEPMVRDNAKTLIWQGCAAGLSGGDCQTGTATKMNWDAADYYCTTTLNAQNWGGYSSGWRLPIQLSMTDGELSSIVKLPCPSPVTQGNACIDNSAFPNTPESWFWSSSYANASSVAWYVDFGNGHVYISGKSSVPFVRCVRSGP